MRKVLWLGQYQRLPNRKYYKVVGLEDEGKRAGVFLRRNSDDLKWISYSDVDSVSRLDQLDAISLKTPKSIDNKGF